MFNEGRGTRYTGRDLRFTMKGDTLYAIALERPQSQLVITSLAAGGPERGEITKVELLGQDAPLEFTQDSEGLKIKLPTEVNGEHAFAFKISGLQMGK